MASSSPLRLSGLKELADMHYDVGVLHLMQSDLFLQCIESMQMTRSEVSRSEVIARAERLLPTGAALQQMYFRRYAGLAAEPIRRLEQTADHLARCASHLEGIAARDLVSRNQAIGEPLTMDVAAQAIAQRYAQLIQAAKTLEKHGVISVTHSERLTCLTERPEGPLAPYFDKAIALMEHQAPRARMVA